VQLRILAGQRLASGRNPRIAINSHFRSPFANNIRMKIRSANQCQYFYAELLSFV
jgi:hypothetical protein